MPAKTRDGLVHRIEEHARPDYYGRFTCGVVYEPRRKGYAWQAREPHVRRAARSPGPVTCLSCAADARAVFPTVDWPP